MATKKVGLTGKYGPRYGSVIRQKVLAAAVKKRLTCPRCLRPGLSRQAAGIWACGRCGMKAAGKAYKP